MLYEVALAMIAFFGTLVGTFGGILASNKLTEHRLLELEKKVDKHNHLVERMAVTERDLKAAFRILDEVKEKVK